MEEITNIAQQRWAQHDPLLSDISKDEPSLFELMIESLEKLPLDERNRLLERLQIAAADTRQLDRYELVEELLKMSTRSLSPQVARELRRLYLINSISTQRHYSAYWKMNSAGVVIKKPPTEERSSIVTKILRPVDPGLGLKLIGTLSTTEQNKKEILLFYRMGIVASTSLTLFVAIPTITGILANEIGIPVAIALLGILIAFIFERIRFNKRPKSIEGT